MNHVMPPHYILLNKEEKTNVGNVVGFIKRDIVLVHLKPWPPTLTLINHVPIAIHMSTMQIITSNCIQSYNKAHHGWLMLVKAKGLRKVIKGKIWSTKGWPPSQLQVNPTPWDNICLFGSPNYEHDGTSEVQCTCLREGERTKIHHVF